MNTQYEKDYTKENYEASTAGKTYAEKIRWLVIELNYDRNQRHLFRSDKLMASIEILTEELVQLELSRVKEWIKEGQLK